MLGSARQTFPQFQISPGNTKLGFFIRNASCEHRCSSRCEISSDDRMRVRSEVAPVAVSHRVPSQAFSEASQGNASRLDRKVQYGRV